MTKIWARIVNWFENGDLMPPIILVSVPHYAHVLSKYDWWWVAAVIGFLVDVGHYRTIKAYLKGHSWFWMVVLTIFSFGFHFGFYWLGGAGLPSIFFASAVPAVIFALSFLAKSERLSEKAKKAVEKWEVKPEVSEKFQEIPGSSIEVPQIASPKRRFSNLAPEEVLEVANLTPVEIASKFGITRRAAQDWRAKAAEILQVQEEK